MGRELRVLGSLLRDAGLVRVDHQLDAISEAELQQKLRHVLVRLLVTLPSLEDERPDGRALVTTRLSRPSGPRFRGT
jgi:hypothetical protein